MPLLLGGVALEASLAVAAGAMGVFAIGRVPSPPKVLKARGIVGEVRQELGHRILGSRRLRSTRLVSVGRWHICKAT